MYTMIVLNGLGQHGVTLTMKESTFERSSLVKGIYPMNIVLCVLMLIKTAQSLMSHAEFSDNQNI